MRIGTGCYESGPPSTTTNDQDLERVEVGPMHHNGMSLLFFACVITAASPGLMGCQAAPKDIVCQSDDTCQSRGEGFKFCIEPRCVRCAGVADCPSGLDRIEGQMLLKGGRTTYS